MRLRRHYSNAIAEFHSKSNQMKSQIIYVHSPVFSLHTMHRFEVRHIYFWCIMSISVVCVLRLESKFSLLFAYTRESTLAGAANGNKVIF